MTRHVKNRTISRSVELSGTSSFLAGALLSLVLSGSVLADGVPVYQARLLETYDAAEAHQGIAVDARYFYALANFTIVKQDRTTGQPVGQWRGRSKGDPLIHLDGLVAWEGKLFAAHSNYPRWPMTSSVEIWDAETLQHVGTHSFGIDRGSFTWLDRHDGYWWGAFANYDRVQDGASMPYGKTDRTQVVKMNDRFAVIESWTIPTEILDRFRPMSNSGGSWGPDGFLYITGHDLGEVYAMSLPAAGSVLHWAATVEVPEMEGQGIAWDRSTNERQLWAISRREQKVLKIEMPVIAAPRQSSRDPR